MNPYSQSIFIVRQGLENCVAHSAVAWLDRWCWRSKIRRRGKMSGGIRRCGGEGFLAEVFQADRQRGAMKCGTTFVPDGCDELAILAGRAGVVGTKRDQMGCFLLCYFNAVQVASMVILKEFVAILKVYEIPCHGMVAG